MSSWQQGLIRCPLPGVTIDNQRVLDNAGALAMTQVPARFAGVYWCWRDWSGNGFGFGNA